MDFILLLKAAVLGLVEGATEFIPVSSTGHLIIAQDWLGFHGRTETAFLIFIQLGAILAVLWLYREKFWRVTKTLPSDPVSRRLVINLIVGTIPAVIIGLPTEEWIEKHLFHPFPVALALVGGGIAIFAVERWHRQTVVSSVDDLPVRLALAVGVLQVLAIIFPGVSRSGATIMGGLAIGLSRRAAAEFSFFLAIPAMIGASMIKLWNVRDVFDVQDIPVFAVGFVVAFISALFVINWLLSLVASHSFRGFGWYRIVFGLILIAIYWDAAGFAEPAE